MWGNVFTRKFGCPVLIIRNRIHYGCLGTRHWSNDHVKLVFDSSINIVLVKTFPGIIERGITRFLFAIGSFIGTRDGSNSINPFSDDSYEFCEKWEFEIVNFLKYVTLKMWILSKMRLWKCEFCKIWYLQNVTFWMNWGFLPHCEFCEM